MWKKRNTRKNVLKKVNMVFPQFVFFMVRYANKPILKGGIGTEKRKKSFEVCLRCRREKRRRDDGKDNWTGEEEKGGREGETPARKLGETGEGSVNRNARRGEESPDYLTEGGGKKPERKKT